MARKASRSRNPEVDAWLGKVKKWQKELKKLRTIVLGCGLTEELKWYKPCYTLRGSNVAILQGFKGYCALMFFKGALLKDPHGVLKRPGEHSQAGRQMVFTDVREIVEMEPVVRAYVQEAIEVEKAGLKVKLKKTTGPVPEEFRKKLERMPALKAAFSALTPGRQRAYVFYFSGAKQPKTRESRVEKCVRRILDGKGLDD